MKRFLAYFWYVLCHKWYVFKAGKVLSVPLWRRLTHDWTKFTPSEFKAYSRNFFNWDGTRKFNGAQLKSYRIEDQNYAFQSAWCRHQKRNDHHWQAWVVVGVRGHLEAVEMPEVCVREMVADWIGAGMATSGRKDPTEWWQASRSEMILNWFTVEQIKYVLKVYQAHLKSMDKREIEIISSER